MLDTPLHPALVHVPIGLACVLPLLAIAFGMASWRAAAAKRAWVLFLVLQAIVAGGGVLALQTGERDEERVEDVVASHVVERHEEHGLQFLWGAVAVLGLSVLMLALPGGAAARTAKVVLVAASFAVAGLAVRAGHSGGELVYVHGAASAHVRAPTAHTR